MTDIRPLTVAEACERTRLSRRSFYRLVGQGRIRVFHQGRRTFVTERELNAYLASVVAAA